jgi:hypothetical protein
MLIPLKHIEKLVFATTGYILTAELTQYGTKIVDYWYVRNWMK